MRSIVSFFCVLLLVALCVSSTATPLPKANAEQSVFDELYGHLQSLSIDPVLAHAAYFSSLNTRMTGYLGCETAGDYILSRFVEYGLSQVSYHYYNAAIPVDHGTYVEILPDNIRVKAYALWPNGIETSSADVTGQLIYARDGDWHNFDGKKVEGSIVLLDFNSRDNWLRAAELGAKAVVFMEPEDTSSVEAGLKKLGYAPLNFPRVYLEKAEAQFLLSLLDSRADMTVRVVSNMTYEKVLARNVIGFVSGQDPDPAIRDQIVILVAHYDSVSVVPALSPGASEAFGISALLELAKFYAQHPPPRTLMFMAVSGHGENMLGARAFLSDIVWFDKNITLASRFVNAICVDISAETNMTAFFHSFVGSDISLNWYGAYYRDFIVNMTGLWRRLYGGDNTYTVEGYPNMLPLMMSPIDITSEGDLFGRTGVFATTQATGHCWYRYRSTPLDTLDKYSLGNIRPQFEALFSNVYVLLHSLRRTPLQPFEVGFARFPSGLTAVQGGGFGLIVGQVVEHNVTSGWYRPVPNSIVLIRPEAGGEKYVTFSDDRGIFTYPGSLPVSRWGYYYSVDAYVIDRGTNALLYAPDFGRYISSYVNRIEIPMEGYVGTLNNPRPFVVSRGGSVALLDLMATEQLSPTLSYVSVEVKFTPGSIVASVQVNDIRTHAPPDHFSYVAEGSVAVIFAPPSVPIEVIIRNEPLPTPMVILTNASEQHPEGSGIVTEVGQQLRLSNSVLRSATDLSLLNDARLADAHGKNLHTGAEDYDDEAATAMLDASSALVQDQISSFYSETVKSWSLSRKVYQLTRESMEAATSTATLIYMFLIPFAIILEEMLFSFAKASKKFLAIALTFVAFLLVLVAFHPGFQIASSIYISLLGLTIITFIAPVVFILASNAARFLGEIRVKLIGEHYAGISRASATLMSFDMGISQMKKRKFRTSLTLISLIVITSSFVMFTSVYPYTTVKEFPRIGQAYYTGLYVRDLKYSSLNYWLPDALSSGFDASETVVCPRAVLYPPGEYLKGGFKLFSYLNGQTREGRVYAVYGLTSEEASVTGWSSALASGQWLPAGELHVAVIGDELAEKLDVRPGDTVSLEGLPLRLVGILNTTKADSIVDLDQNTATPRDLRIITGIGFFSTRDLVFVPYGLAIDIGGNAYAAVLGFQKSDGVQDAAIALAKQTTLQVYASKEVGRAVEVDNYAIAKGVTSYGFSTFLLPLAILALSVLNLVLAVVFERSKEIGVLGAIGLSPLHIIGIFLGEIVTYAVVSVVIGYVSGIILLQVLIQVPGFFPIGFFPNYSSMFAVLTIGLILAVIIIPSFYPLYKASRMVTPSLERRFTISTKPVGNHWAIPLPFVFVSQDEAKGSLVFLREYFNTYAVEGAGVPFATKETSYEEKATDGEGSKTLSVVVHIAPFPAGINQRMNINATFDPKDRRWVTGLEITRMTGEANTWKKSNYVVIDAVRKQFLQWRSLSPAMKSRYQGEAQ
jgi:ABC-type antimicrobial peptide transport system permease subunit